MRPVDLFVLFLCALSALSFVSSGYYGLIFVTASFSLYPFGSTFARPSDNEACILYHFANTECKLDFFVADDLNRIRKDDSGGMNTDGVRALIAIASLSRGARNRLLKNETYHDAIRESIVVDIP